MENSVSCAHDALEEIFVFKRSRWLMCNQPGCPDGVHQGKIVHAKGRIGERLEVREITEAPLCVVKALDFKLSHNGGVEPEVAERIGRVLARSLRGSSITKGERERKEKPRACSSTSSISKGRHVFTVTTHKPRARKKRRRYERRNGT